MRRRLGGEVKERKLLRGPQSRRFEYLSAIHIFREYFMGLRALRSIGPCVTVFGSARIAEGHPYYELGRRVGKLLAEAGFSVMTGGGPGLMEAANRGAREAEGHTVGCNIELPHEQLPNRYLDTSVTFRHFFVRKVMLVKYSYGFIALPGGFGTFDELFEAATLVQNQKIKNFPIVLLGVDFWKPVVETLRSQLVANGTVTEDELAHLYLTDDPLQAVDYVVTVVGGLGLKLGLTPPIGAPPRATTGE